MIEAIAGTFVGMTVWLLLVLVIATSIGKGNRE